MPVREDNGSAGPALIACEECDTLQRVHEPPPGHSMRCVCCGARLYSKPRGGIEVPLALIVAALVLYLVANLYPLLTLELQGSSRTTTLSGASWALYQDGMPLLAAAVWFTSVLAPGLVIVSSLYVLGALYFSRRLPALGALLAGFCRLNPWGMMDVFMLGVLVALVKLMGQASVVPGPGLYAFAVLIFVFAAAAARLEPRLLWERLEGLR